MGGMFGLLDMSDANGLTIFNKITIAVELELCYLSDPCLIIIRHYHAQVIK